MTNPEDIEKVGDTHYEIVSYDVDEVEIISAPLDMKQAIEMATGQCGWNPESISVIRKVVVTEVFFPNSRVGKIITRSIQE